MAQNVRFAIVGLGMGMGRARICAETEGAELVAVCDIWEERAKKARDEFGVEWIRDFHDVLARKDIDVVGIWTPSGMHASMAMEAMEAGKHVCMTKPMDIETEICDRAIDLADRKGLVLAVDFASRYSLSNHQLRCAIRSGAIGKIILADLRMKWYRAQTYYDSGMPEGWRSRMKTERGSLANQAVHFLDLLQWWLGPVRRVVGKRGTFAHSIETEDTSAAVLEFGSGAFCSIATTTASFPNLGTTVELTGTSGTVTWQDQGITRFVAAKNVDAKAHEKAGYDAAFPVDAEAGDLKPEDFPVDYEVPDSIIADMVGAVRGGNAPQCDGREGRKSVALFEAIYESSDTGAWVTL